ncbi:Holliday junction resolvase RuvX [Lyngbya sp. CCAP 1446/10]|uniref:Holliday junction resolvase RuvX n=1 Tax=Lyngbya sp. CCAP 1446/10 TaxID=439293 RepID=UPI002237CA66|nr:Holliday junction resolvase RuvX [Lyngbya sp. CCAP 1446/10]MCW6049975.1 Holliday junction resolvase RuvX [Lyngbya sp. CCAP 1446/10]
MSNEKLWISALGLDIGSKRVGIAGCDGTGLIATGITTLVRSSFDRDVAYLRGLVQERRVEILVAGLPYSLNGEVGAQARQVQKYASRIATALDLPLEYADERLTSVGAEELIRDQGMSPSQNKGLIDRKAAALILQQWLDERRQKIGAIPNPDRL